MNIENNIKLWSSLGMRATFGLIAMELAKKNPDLMITTSDVSTSAGLDRYKNKYPEKFIDVGIAEQNLIGISAGLSSEGFKVISTTFLKLAFTLGILITSEIRRSKNSQVFV